MRSLNKGLLSFTISALRTPFHMTWVHLHSPLLDALLCILSMGGGVCCLCFQDTPFRVSIPTFSLWTVDDISFLITAPCGHLWRLAQCREPNLAYTHNLLQLKTRISLCSHKKTAASERRSKLAGAVKIYVVFLYKKFNSVLQTHMYPPKPKVGSLLED